jgi:hypothetical protein
MTRPALLSGWLWGFFLPGPRELALVVLVVIALYGRSILARGGKIRPTAGRRLPRRPGHRAWVVERWPWAFAAIASAAAAAWVVTRLTVPHRPPGP